MAVVAAIDEKGGLVHSITRANLITSADFIAFLTELCAACPERLTLFLDQAAIHRARVTQEAMAALGCEPHWNLPFRRDLNAIEAFWAVEKEIFT